MSVTSGLTEGRIVHYVAYNGRHLAAMVTGYSVDKPGHVDLAVFTNMPNVNGDPSGGVQFHFNVPPDSHMLAEAVGHWHWPQGCTSLAPQQQEGERR